MKQTTKRILLTFLFIFCVVFVFSKEAIGTSIYNEGFIEFKENEQQTSPDSSANKMNPMPKETGVGKEAPFPKMGEQEGKLLILSGLLLVFLVGIGNYWRKRYEK